MPLYLSGIPVSFVNANQWTMYIDFNKPIWKIFAQKKQI